MLSATTGDVVDLLLLVKLPLRFSPMMLELDFLDPPPMLPVGSLAVAPLRAVVVGEGCILCDDDREGTCRRVWFFFSVSFVVTDDSSPTGTEVRSGSFVIWSCWMSPTKVEMMLAW